VNFNSSPAHKTNDAEAPVTDAYSIVIPAYNEEDLLPATLDALAEAMQTIDAPGEIVVVDNNSTDATAQIAEARGARVVFEPVNQIARARNAGAAAAAHDRLLFVDADTLIPVDVLRQALANLASGSCCGGGVLVEFDTAGRPGARSLVRFWNWLSLRNRWAAGCFVYCRRDAFDAAGRFSERVYASEEIWLSRRLGRWGRKHGMTFEIIIDPPVRTSNRKLVEQPVRAFLTFVLVTLFPFAIWFRPLCGLWYRRPKKPSAPPLDSGTRA